MNKLDAQKIPINYASAVGWALEELGENKVRIFSELGINIDELEKPEATIQGTLYKKLIEKGILLNDSAIPFSFLVAKHIKVTSHGILGLAAMSADNLGELLELSRFFPLLMPGIEFNYFIHDKNVTCEFTPIEELGTEVSAAIVEIYVLIFLQFSLYLEKPMSERRVGFSHKTSYDKSVYDEYFGCPVAFGCNTNKIIIPEHYINTPLVSSDPSTLNLSKQYLEQGLKLLSKKNQWSEKVANYWRECAQKSKFLIQDELAADFNMTVRTLARKLNNENTSYQEVISNVRKSMAVFYLIETNMRIYEIALATGFKDTSTFNRAFRGWFKCTPSAYRSNQ